MVASKTTNRTKENFGFTKHLQFNLLVLHTFYWLGANLEKLFCKNDAEKRGHKMRPANSLQIIGLSKVEETVCI